MKHEIPKDVRTVLETLNRNGYEAYIVGGAVRDYYLGNVPHDWDITTNAKPEDVQRIFDKTADFGAKFGMVKALLPEMEIEIATFRKDGNYEDGRHPDSVEWTNNIMEDLCRRDFTMNAMAMDKDGNIIDPFGGKEDLDHGVIRCVGNPETRMKEDALRMLRAVRFAAKHQFSIEPKTEEAIQHGVEAQTLQMVSSERKQDELTKLLMTDHPGLGLQKAYALGITETLIPEFNAMMEMNQRTPYGLVNVGEFAISCVDSVPKNEDMRLAALLFATGKPLDERVTMIAGKAYDSCPNYTEKSDGVIRDISERLHFSRAREQRIRDIVKLQTMPLHIFESNYQMRKAVSQYGPDVVRDALTLRAASIEAYPENVRKHMREELNALTAYKKAFQECIHDHTAVTLQSLAVNGYDCLQAGLSGKAIGEFLNSALEDVWRNPEHNNREYLTEMAHQLVEEQEMKVQEKNGFRMPEIGDL